MDITDVYNLLVIQNKTQLLMLGFVLFFLIILTFLNFIKK
jgi:hypothetical protein